MEEINVDLWQIFGGMQYRILLKKILERFVGGMKEVKGCTSTKYLKWKKIMPTFEYEPLVCSVERETSDKEEHIEDTGGVGPSSTRITEEERWDLRGGKESLNGKVVGGTYALEQILEPFFFVVQDVKF
jgi:hypothetical protein